MLSFRLLIGFLKLIFSKLPNWNGHNYEGAASVSNLKAETGSLQ